MAAEVLPGEDVDLAARIAQDLSQVVVALTGKQGIDELLTAYIGEVRTLIPCQAVGIYLHRGTGQPPVFRAVGVSEDYLELYEDIGRGVDPVLQAVMESREPRASSQIMRLEDWLESDFYRKVLSMYGLQSTMKAPILVEDRIIGTLNFGDRHPLFFDQGAHLALTRALGRIVGMAVTGVVAQDAIRRERDHLAQAVDLSQVAMVLSDTRTGWRFVNSEARQLLHALDAGRSEEALGALLASSRAMIANGSGERESVPIGDGSEVVIRSLSPGRDRALVITTFEAGVGDQDVAPFVQAMLSPRERQIAAFVSLGMHDQQIADHLVLSVHTVKQHLKRIYRKLGVTSRVELARAVLLRRGGSVSDPAVASDSGPGAAQ